MDNHIIKKQLSAACRLSMTRFTLNYDSLFEYHIDNDFSESLKDMIGQFNSVAALYFHQEDALDALISLRNHTIAFTEQLTLYTDCFQIYEYILNRLERRFKTCPDIDDDVDALADQLMEFLFSDKEPAIVNGRIQEIIRQLPVRYTRSKFFELMRNAMAIYEGAQTDAFNQMMYMIRSESMIEIPDSADLKLTKLHNALTYFRQLDLKNIQKTEYDIAVSKILDISNIINEISCEVIMLQELINDLYVMILTKNIAVVDVFEKSILEQIFQELHNRTIHNIARLSEEDITDLLIQLEGKQEELYEKYNRVALPANDSADSNLDRGLLSVWSKVDLLLSSSSFMNVDEQEKKAEVLGKDQMQPILEQYFAEADAAFRSMQKPVVRAIMAKILSDLPVFFHNPDEIRNYITGSLNSCTDIYEKQTSMELLTSLMESNYAMV